MSGKRVKGTMLLDQVKMLRKNKHLDWEAYLDREDWDIVHSQIMPFQWYPLETYERLGWAAFQLLAGGSLVRIQQHGRDKGKELFGEVYSSLLKYQDPGRAIEAFVKAYGTLFDFNTLSFERSADKCVVVKHSFPEHDNTNMVYCHQLTGMLQTLAEMSGGENVSVSLLAREWAGGLNTVIEITWV